MVIGVECVCCDDKMTDASSLELVVQQDSAATCRICGDECDSDLEGVIDVVLGFRRI